MVIKTSEFLCKRLKILGYFQNFADKSDVCYKSSFQNCYNIVSPEKGRRRNISPEADDPDQ